MYQRNVSQYKKKVYFNLLSLLENSVWTFRNWTGLECRQRQPASPPPLEAWVWDLVFNLHNLLSHILTFSLTSCDPNVHYQTTEREQVRGSTTKPTDSQHFWPLKLQLFTAQLPGLGQKHDSSSVLPPVALCQCYCVSWWTLRSTVSVYRTETDRQTWVWYLTRIEWR